MTNRRKRKSAILTDTPEKDALEAEYSKRKSAVKNLTGALSQKPASKGKSRKKAKKTSEVESDDEEECFCLVCLEPFSQSSSKEVWVQCTHCKLWAHELCTPGTPWYVCHNCDEDDDA